MGLKIAGLQLDCVWEQKEKNFERVLDLAREAMQGGAQLLVLPEMFATGFSLRLNITMEEEGGITWEFLRNLAIRHNTTVIGGLVLKAHGGWGRNCAVVFDNQGNNLGVYTKCHTISLMGEHLYHEAGKGPLVVQVGDTNISPFICYDLRFPELFRTVAHRSHMMVVIASWPAVRQRHWDQLLIARAIENQCYVLGVNRVGEGGGNYYAGGSALYDPLGNLLAGLKDQEGLLMGEIDPAMVDKVREEYPFLKDKRFI